MTRRKAWVVSGVIGALLLLTLAAKGERPAPKSTKEPRRETFEVGLPTTQEVRAMVGAYGQRIEETEKGLFDLKSDLSKMRASLEDSLRTLLQQAVKPEEAARPPDLSRLRVFDFGSATKGGVLHIPAGSFGEATLLTGVYAPTNGEPLPVLLRLDAALIGPNRTRIPLPRALLVGKAVGDANSRRATVQIESLSIAATAGKSADLKANGWIVDEDGIQGLKGVYVWRADEIAALSAAAGGLSAGAEAMAAREMTHTVTPLGGSTGVVTGDPLRLAEFKALGGASSRLGELILERMKEIVPAIHVTNGRRVTVAFIQGITVDGWTPEEVHSASSGDPYRGLDGPR